MLSLCITLIFGGVLFGPAPVFADISIAPNLGIDTVAKNAELNTEKSLPKITGKVLGAALSMIGLTFFIITVYAGVIWMTAHGNEEAVTKARNTLIAATIGLLIVFGAYAITKFAFESVQGGASSDGGSPPAADNRCGQVGPGFSCKNIATCAGIDNADDVDAARAQCTALDTCELNLCAGGNDVVCCQ